MTHLHVWESNDVAKVGGCRENPGCFSQGKTMRFNAVCACGARKLTITSVAPFDRGEYREITTASGRVTRRDTRNWS